MFISYFQTTALSLKRIWLQITLEIVFLIDQFSIKSAALLQLKDAAEICFCKYDTEIKCII